MTINVNKINQNNGYKKHLNIERSYSSLAMKETHQTTINVGWLIPIWSRELLPSQQINVNETCQAQFFPWVSTVIHRIMMVKKTFFTPYRILDKNWEEFIQGGIDGKNAYEMPYLDLKTIQLEMAAAGKSIEGSVLDYLGYPINNLMVGAAKTAKMRIMDYYVKAYNMIYNEHYRPVDIQQEKVGELNFDLIKCLWENDYYTNGQVYQLRGITPIVPIAEGSIARVTTFDGFEYTDGSMTGEFGTIGTIPVAIGGRMSDGKISSLNIGSTFMQVDLGSGGVGINVNDMLNSILIMAMLSNNAKMEYRYIDWLEQRFGIKRQDARLQRPELIGVDTFEITAQGIVQTSYGDAKTGQTPQGHVTSQAGLNTGSMTVNYEAQEHGIIMTIIEIKPATVYEQGLNAMHTCRTKEEFGTPELENAPAVPIRKGEVYFDQSDADIELFSWKGIYDETRTATNKVTGLLRPTATAGLASFTLARKFESHVEYNIDFVQCNADMQRIKVYTDEPDAIFIHTASIGTSLPLPLESNPAELL